MCLRTPDCPGNAKYHFLSPRGDTEEQKEIRDSRSLQEDGKEEPAFGSKLDHSLNLLVRCAELPYRLVGQVSQEHLRVTVQNKMDFALHFSKCSQSHFQWYHGIADFQSSREDVSYEKPAEFLPFCSGRVFLTLFLCHWAFFCSMFVWILYSNG